MYFDHIQCPSCDSRFSPEQLGGNKGETPTCPSCGAPISMRDLFGVSDAFVGIDDDEGNGLSLDDLLPGAPAPRSPQPSTQRGAGARAADRAMVRRADANQAPTSARDALRELRRKK